MRGPVSELSSVGRAFDCSGFRLWYQRVAGSIPAVRIKKYPLGYFFMSQLHRCNSAITLF